MAETNIIYIFSLLIAFAQSSHLGFYVNPHTQHCLYEDLEVGQSVLTKFSLVRGMQQGVDLNLYGPYNALISVKIIIFNFLFL